MKTENRGGKRTGAGRPQLPYKRKIISFNICVEFEPAIRKVVKELILKLKNENLDL